MDDIRAFTGGFVIERAPVLDSAGDVPRSRYKTAYLAHLERMRAIGEKMNHDFWPRPPSADNLHDDVIVIDDNSSGSESIDGNESTEDGTCRPR